MTADYSSSSTDWEAQACCFTVWRVRKNTRSVRLCLCSTLRQRFHAPLVQHKWRSEGRRKWLHTVHLPHARARTHRGENLHPKHKWATPTWVATLPLHSASEWTVARLGSSQAERTIPLTQGPLWLYRGTLFMHFTQPNCHCVQVFFFMGEALAKQPTYYTAYLIEAGKCKPKCWS